jgi:ABC-type dipeptide/oligopeptide/nickel transport systems, permease components
MKKKLLIRRMLRSKFFMIGAGVAVILVVLSIIAPYIVVHDPLTPDLAKRFLKPQFFSKGWSGYILGTDAIGRDILTRVLLGSRSSFYIASMSFSLSAIIGTVLGIMAGYYGGIVDSVVMRACDVFLSIPGLVLSIAVIAVLGNGITILIVVLIIGSWVQYAKLVRNNVVIIREQEFVKASKVLGANNIHIMFTQVFPNVVTPLIILCSQQFGMMILIEASLSFLSLGIQPPAPSWGNMIADGRAYLSVAPWVVIAPGIALMITVLAFNFLGDGLRDVLDQKQQ